jgi:hypothetical protein
MAKDSPPGDAFDGDYLAEAELYAVQRRGRKQALFYQRFDSTAEAMRFALEDMPADTSNVVLETESLRLDIRAITGAYEAESFPLPRRPLKS